MTFFHPHFAGATGSPDDLRRVASAYGVYQEVGPASPDDPGNYPVDHKASLLGISPDGALRVVWPSGVTAGALAADVAELLP